VAVYAGSRIDAMAIGALGGWLLFRRVEPVLRLLHSRWIQALTLAALAALYLRVLKLPRLSYEAYAALFMIVILNAASNPRSFFRHHGRFLERLGRISYGIYMYHPITVTSVIIGLGSVTADRGPVFVSAVYLLGIATTILLAAASYRFFESPILKQKLRASPLITGDLVAER